MTEYVKSYIENIEGVFGTNLNDEWKVRLGEYIDKIYEEGFEDGSQTMRDARKDKNYNMLQDLYKEMLRDTDCYHGDLDEVDDGRDEFVKEQYDQWVKDNFNF